MTTLESIKETVKRELPAWLESDPAFREAILGLTANLYSRREETNDWFHQTLDEMRRERERQDALWRKNDERLERERVANQVELAALHEESLALGKRIDRSIGALGARWGLRSEKAFRDALAGILEKTFDVEVLNVSEYDDAGEVFGRPDQIEIDVIIKNGLLILCELKSSIDKAGMSIFEHKARFYERHHQRQANRLIVISPMIDSRAQDVARRLGIETYGEPEEVSG
ncbi:MULTISPECIES: PD-(D/E)XK nuclease family protein [Thiorhodovibrio]|uniref:PD-(D/E)XK nuclease family protein n=1 Tax=Thiorhodovibrio TaxID=61593 RepID=UPI001913DEBA|nr:MULTISPECIES: DUF3782 domain-containing protein [Thiorhodovibrio]MBK5967616.1 hypothetical protein [Thiorhodovibrio winogradskyi]WPL13079.1 hypothetical protein Thiosp_02867 [Thiorhodovibrio litoralis]